MIEVSTVTSLRAEISARRARGKRIALVPTMGNLHIGHRRLMDEARKLADVVAVSIYVNPLQFGPKEDFAAYPRTPAEDRALAADAKVDLLFVPSDSEMYPRGREWQTQVEVPRLGDILCGAFRPGHFRGVTTVVARLFNLVAPDMGVFGNKDFQQLLLIRRMVADLAMPIEIVGVETVRERDGLAVSSRNRYLSDAERKAAPMLHEALRRLSHALRQGTPIAQAEAAAGTELERAGFRPDYVSVRRPNDLGEPESADKSLIVLAAAWLGRTRLIDNLEFEI
ncbi:MAG TPA: pantoate--beta-alanine ligase [Burkholderiales bacterium]|jgi:pantoate--beta-alanine ligase